MKATYYYENAIVLPIVSSSCFFYLGEVAWVFTVQLFFLSPTNNVKALKRALPW